MATKHKLEEPKFEKHKLAKHKVDLKKPLQRPCLRESETVLKSFASMVETLSYTQLLRVSSAVSATSDKEKAAAKLFYHSLTTIEILVARAIQYETNPGLLSRKIEILQHSLRKKNEAEIVGINIDDILQDAKNVPDL